MDYYIKEKIKDFAVWTAIFALATFIGAGAAILVTNAIDYTKQTACFDYQTEEACEEIKQ